MNVRLEETDGIDEVAITTGEGEAKEEHEAPARSRGAGPRRDRADPRSRRELRRGRPPRHQEGAHAARADDRQPLLRVQHPDASSFELAAKRLSADVVSVKSAGSSVDKGESLKDTVATLSAYDPAAIVIRSPHAGAAGLVARWTEASVINAGDGKHEHPTQALLDVFTLRQRLGIARRYANLDRRRRPPQPGRPVLPARLSEDGGRGDPLRPTDPDPARDRGARLRGRHTTWTRPEAPTSSTRFGCSASG